MVSKYVPAESVANKDVGSQKVGWRDNHQSFKVSGPIAHYLGSDIGDGLKKRTPPASGMRPFRVKFKSKIVWAHVQSEQYHTKWSYGSLQKDCYLNSYDFSMY